MESVLSQRLTVQMTVIMDMVAKIQILERLAAFFFIRYSIPDTVIKFSAR